MARPLHDLPITGFFTSLSNTTVALFVLAAAFAVASMVSFLCTSHKHSKILKREEMPPCPSSDRKLLSSFSNIGGKALVMAKMISWKRGGDGSEEEAVWKKAILKGGRCQPLQFSGRIMYDSEGNQLPELETLKSQGKS